MNCTYICKTQITYTEEQLQLAAEQICKTEIRQRHQESKKCHRVWEEALPNQNVMCYQCEASSFKSWVYHNTS